MKELFSYSTQSTQVSLGEISLRAVFLFFITLIIVRFAGRRSFSLQTPFDVVTSILLGSVLVEGLIGKIPFGNSIVVALILAALHRIIAMISLKSHTLGRLVKAEATII